jgi:heptosyltransferase-2
MALHRLVGPRSRERSSESSYEILVLRLDGIGDMVLTGPFLRGLRQAFPDARISCVVAPHALGLLEVCPYIDRVLTLRLPVASRWWHPLTRRGVATSFARRHLWQTRFDLAVSPRWGTDRYEAAVLAYLSGAPTRLGFADNDRSGLGSPHHGFDRFLTQAIEDESVKHEVRRNLELLSTLRDRAFADELEVWWSKRDERFARDILASSLESPLVALGPGAGAATRMWPIDRFVDVGGWLIGAGYRLVVVGGAEDEALGARLGQLGDRVVDLTNRATLRQTAAVLRMCHLYCGNDAGPMHLAAAVGIPVVEISCHPPGGDNLHPNSPDRFGPWGVPHRILRPNERRDGCVAGCRERTPHCILNVSSEAVIGAIRSLDEDFIHA